MGTESFCKFLSPSMKWKSKVRKKQVGVIWVLEFLHAIAITHWIYYYSVIRYGDPRAVLELTTTGDIAVLIAAIIGPVVQQRGVGMVVRDNTHILNVKRRVNHGVLVLLLVDVSRRNPRKVMKTIIDKLILWTIQTGLITSCGTTIQLILFLVLDNYGWLAIFLIVPRLFSNSLMASLNARADLRSINEASGLDSNLNFDLQSTRQTRISIAMTSVREQRHADVELGKPHGADFGLTEITPHATKREWK
ncbi:hypothetical protein J132_07178 [Termitomyces sp. J132]|nr:hypothetical protein J132_07178 [Termitomyces sp. J132]